MAALDEFGNNEVTLKPYGCIKDIFSSLQAGVIQHGVVPFENSTYGVVDRTLEALALQDWNVTARAERYVAVRHCLIGHPGRPFTSIKRVHSHPQALGQCANFLKEQFPHATLHDEASTSYAVEVAAKDQAAAAIGRAVAAQANRLEVLAEGIQDRADNATRFLIFGHGCAELKRLKPDKPLIPWDVEEYDRQETELPEAIRTDRWKTLLAFTVEHGKPGALADALAIFKAKDVNVTSLNSHPLAERPWQYMFFVECEDKNKGKLAEAVKALKSSTEYKWWGSFMDKREDFEESLRQPSEGQA